MASTIAIYCDIYENLLTLFTIISNQCIVRHVKTIFVFYSLYICILLCSKYIICIYICMYIQIYMSSNYLVLFFCVVKYLIYAFIIKRTKTLITVHSIESIFQWSDADFSKYISEIHTISDSKGFIMKQVRGRADVGLCI